MIPICCSNQELIFAGKTTGNDQYWCENCGSLVYEGSDDSLNEVNNPTIMDKNQETLIYDRLDKATKLLEKLYTLECNGYDASKETLDEVNNFLKEDGR
jgi:hypothetical protein